MTNALKIIKKLVLGNYAVDRKLNPAIQNQVTNLKRAWEKVAAELTGAKLGFIGFLQKETNWNKLISPMTYK